MMLPSDNPKNGTSAAKWSLNAPDWPGENANG
jgi:hypothetical protein